MNRLSTLLLGLVLLTGYSACKNRNQVPENARILFQKTACFGTCPIYNMTINGSGHATFTGERFTKNIGTFTKQLTAQETKLLFQELSEYDWESYENYYPTQVSDLPSVIIGFKYKKVEKQVTVRGEHPESLDVLTNRLSNIAEGDGWVSETTN